MENRNINNIDSVDEALKLAYLNLSLNEGSVPNAADQLKNIVSTQYKSKPSEEMVGKMIDNLS